MYLVNEMFRSVQGEGARTGHESLFVRFTGCNMRCAMEPGPKSPGGFDCDTEFVSGRRVNIIELMDWLTEVHDSSPMSDPWVVLTGGEPLLQVDDDLLKTLRDSGYKIQIETNGSKPFEYGKVEFLTVSPKVAEHAIRATRANEVKYVRGYGQPLPETVVLADKYWISAAFTGTTLDARTMAWCRDLCARSDKWEFMLQQHKIMGVQ